MATPSGPTTGSSSSSSGNASDRLTSFNPLSPEARKAEGNASRGSFFSRLFKPTVDPSDGGSQLRQDNVDSFRGRTYATSPVTVPRRLSPASSDDWSVASTPPLLETDGPSAGFAPSSLPDRHVTDIPTASAGSRGNITPPAMRALFAASRSTSAPDLTRLRAAGVGGDKEQPKSTDANMGSGVFGEGLGDNASRGREESSVGGVRTAVAADAGAIGAPGGSAGGHGAGPSNHLDGIRSMTVVLKRLRNIADPQQEDQFLKHYWMPDQNCKECYDCGAPFHTFRRRHHCRICGQIFCWKCCSQAISGDMFGHKGDLRVCNYCHNVIERYKEDEGRAEESLASKRSTPSMSPSPSAKFLARSSSGPALKFAHKNTTGGAAQGTPAAGTGQAQHHAAPEATVRFAEDWPIHRGLSSPHHAAPDDGSESDEEAGPPLPHAPDATSMLDDDDAGGPAWLRQVSHGWSGAAAGEAGEATVSQGESRASADDDSTTPAADRWAAAMGSGASMVPHAEGSGVFASGTPAITMPASPDRVGELPSSTGAGPPVVGSVAESLRSGGSLSIGSDGHDRRYSFNSFKRPRQEFLPKDRYESYIKNALRGEDGVSAEVAEAMGRPFSLSASSVVSTGLSPMMDAVAPVATTEHKDRKPSLERVERERLALQRLIVEGARHVGSLVRQLLRAECLDAEWEGLLMPLVDCVTSEVRPDVRSGDKMDVREYVKVKRIAGGTMSESAHIRGVVITKNVAHKRMCREIHNPRILMLRFAVEYQRADKQLSSLDPLVLQEKDHLKILVAKIASARPDIVLVEKTVSRLAQEYMLEAGIVLALNVKASVMERISRCTGADILTSIDKLNFEPKLGTCASFRLVSYKDDVELLQQQLEDDRPAKPRTLMHFDGCPPHLGCTISVRGATRSELARVKRVVRFAVYVAHSLRLETRLLIDEFATLPDALPDPFALATISECDGHEDAHPVVAPVPGVADEWLRDYVVPVADDFGAAILSGSPSVRFPLPFLYTVDGQQCSTRSLLPAQAYWTRRTADGVSGDASPDASQLPQCGGPSLARESAVADELVPARANAVVDCLSPHNHQSITVLFSSLCPGAANPCIAPQVVRLKYFMDNDMTLGQYLERFCFSSSYRCPNAECDQPMVNHVRSYTHDCARINIALETFQPQVEVTSVILMWSWCKICQEMTPVVPMSDDTWAISFAKYLELSFYGAEYVSRAGTCSHSLHRDHVRYFGCQNLAVQLEYDTIDLLEIAIPPSIIEIASMWSPDWDAEIRSLEATVDRVFEAVRERVAAGPDIELIDHRAEACRDQLREVGAQAERERLQAVDALRQARVLAAEACGGGATSPAASAQLTEHVALLKRSLCLIIAGKNTALADIWHSYAPEKGRRTASSKSTQSSSSSASPAPVSPSPRLLRPLETDGSADSFPPLAGEALLAPALTTTQDDVTDAPEATDLDSVSVLAADATLAAGVGSRSSVYLSLPSAAAQASKPNEKRGAIMKFLTGSSASGYQPIVPPFAVDEHYMLPPGLRTMRVVYEDEPSSIVAYTLCSREYFDQIRLIQSGHRHGAALDVNASSDGEADAVSLQQQQQAALDAIAEEGDDEVAPHTRGSMGSMGQPANTHTHPSHAALPTLPTRSGVPTSGNVHIKHQFSDAAGKFYCKVYFAEQFRCLRQRYVQGGESAYVQSLARCISWAAHGGKSGSTFCKTRDDRYIVKQMSRLEAQSFMEFAEHYFDYMWKDYNGQRPTVMAKILGVYRIGFKNAQTGRSLKQDVLVMENLFYMRRISRIFDLKGSIRSRYVHSTGKDDVLMDENLLEFICESPIFIRPHTKTVLKRSIWNDTSFLSRLNVMDYSLLVGIDEQRRELVIGIIDYIRTFTWDKKLEMWVKSTGLLGGHGKMPTVVSPEVYKSRFREAMDRYFLMVPDKWTGLGLDSLC